MDKVLVHHLSAVRKQVDVDLLREAIVGHCSVEFGEMLRSHLTSLSKDVDMKDISIVPVSLKPFSPEADLFLGLLVLVVLLDRKALAPAQAVASSLIPLTHGVGNDLLVNKIFFYYMRVNELVGKVASVRTVLLAAYRSASVHHSSSRKAVLINLILRSFFLQGLVDQALKFSSKITFPETRSNAEYARYLYYMGVLRAVELQYSESHSFLTQAGRKAPQGSGGRGFKLAATKAGIIVQLLMGEVPERSSFNQFTPSELMPYLLITQAVRSGDVAAFSVAIGKFEHLFVADRLMSLIRRLHQNVLKAGLRSITASYSRIALADVMTKLSLASVDEAADVAAKAIVDRVIDAKIDYAAGVLVSNWGADVYSTVEPAKQLDKRINFCLQLHADCVKAMEFPDVNAMEKELMETNEEILRAQKMDMEEGLDEDDDDMMM